MVSEAGIAPEHYWSRSYRSARFTIWTKEKLYFETTVEVSAQVRKVIQMSRYEVVYSSEFYPFNTYNPKQL